jgi:Tfp pilus assembly protein PilF
MNFKKAIEYDPKNYEAHHWLGFCYYKSGDLEAARKYYEKSLEINPDYGAPYNGLGLIYQQLGDFRKAKENYQIAANLLRKEGREQEAGELESIIEKELP